MTVRETARLLAGLPERWQDVELLGRHDYEDVSLNGVILCVSEHRPTRPQHARLSATFNPTVNMDGIIHPLEMATMFGPAGPRYWNLAPERPRR